MQTSVAGLEYQEDNKRIVATVKFREQIGEVWHDAKVSVFIEWTDSYEEAKRRAIDKAKEFLRSALA